MWGASRMSFSSLHHPVMSARFSIQAIRLTSAGPPPASPSKPGSISYKYDKFIGRWPKVQALHRMVVDGSRWCFMDIKTYFNVRKSLSTGKTLSDLSVPQLEVLVQTPVEGPKLAVVLTLLPLPFTVYIIGFAIIFFPRLVLTRHFWSDDQRRQFFQAEIAKGMINAADLPAAIGMLDKKVTPPKADQLTQSVIWPLCKLHGLFPLPGVGGRLVKRGEALMQLDALLPIYLDALTPRQLYFHMYIRRLSYENLSEEECRQTLLQWLQFTSRMDKASYLAAPFFFNNRNK